MPAVAHRDRLHLPPLRDQGVGEVAAAPLDRTRVDRAGSTWRTARLFGAGYR